MKFPIRTKNNSDLKNIISIQLLNHQKVCYICIKITIERDENDMVSQMAHAENLGETFMAHLENLYNIPCLH